MHTKMLNEALEELFDVIREDELKNIPILVLANKQDISGAMKPEDIVNKLKSEKCMTHARQWMVFGVCAVDMKDNGLQEAFNWLSNEMVENEKNRFACGLLYGADTDKKNNNVAGHAVHTIEKDAKPFYLSFVESLKKMII